MKWLDQNDIDIKSMTGKEVCEKLCFELWDYDYSQWLELEDFIQTAVFIIAFDCELNMEGIFTFLENSLGHYSPNIIKAFRSIGDNRDAELLAEICRLAPPDIMRDEFLGIEHQEYDICYFNEDHELHDEIIDRIAELDDQLYMNTDYDMWQLLYDYLDSQIKML